MKRTPLEALIAMYDRAPINKWFQPELRIPDEGRAEIRLPLREDFHHAAQAIHGAVYFKALDDTTFFAGQSLVTDFFVVTSSFQLYFLRPESEGHLLARGQVVSRSKRLYIAEGLHFDSRGKEVARGSGTFMPSSMQLGPQLGYGGTRRSVAERGARLFHPISAFDCDSLSRFQRRKGENACRQAPTPFLCSDGSA